jgi:hypothetical protein
MQTLISVEHFDFFSRVQVIWGGGEGGLQVVYRRTDISKYSI